MKKRHASLNTWTILTLCLIGWCVAGCANTPMQATACRPESAWPGALVQDEPDQREVSVVIALSSIVPGGVFGHAGIAVDQQYWDFGPERDARLQRLKAISSKAGPWWDDPDQRWQSNRTLAEVARDMTESVHPTGSLVAVFRAQVTDEQADAIIKFWNDTYARMRDHTDRYHLAGRQCSSMVGWSLASALGEMPAGDQPLPSELRLLTPSRLYEILRDRLRNTAGEYAGQPAELTLWQLGPDGMMRYERDAAWDQAGLPELPRLRLALERMKYLPGELLE